MTHPGTYIHLQFISDSGLILIIIMNIGSLLDTAGMKLVSPLVN
jgi:hypothetical protein